MQRLAAAGFGLLALMQVVFFLLGFDRPFPYLQVQLVSLAATMACVVGIAMGRDWLFAAGLGVNLVTRVLQPVLGVTRLPVWITVVLAAGWALAGLQAARGRPASAGVWLLALGHLLAMFATLSRFESALALGIGTVGLFLAAPALGDERASARARSAKAALVEQGLSGDR